MSQSVVDQVLNQAARLDRVGGSAIGGFQFQFQLHAGSLAAGGEFFGDFTGRDMEGAGLAADILGGFQAGEGEQPFDEAL